MNEFPFRKNLPKYDLGFGYVVPTTILYTLYIAKHYVSISIQWLENFKVEEANHIVW